MAAAGVAGVGEWTGVPPAPAGDMSRRPLGRTGLQVPVISLGVMNASNPALLRRAWDLGVRHFDTAAYYQRGRNEEMVGAVIRELRARQETVIATKIYLPPERRHMADEEVRQFFRNSAAESLRRLQTDYVDILYVHNVSDVDYLYRPVVVEVMQALRQAGTARFVGFTTHRGMDPCIAAAAERGGWDVIATAFNYSLGEDRDLLQAMTRAHQQGIGLVAMKTQCTQYWYREHLPDYFQRFYQGEILHTAVLKWAVRHPFVTTAIPGCTTFEQLEADVQAGRSLEYTAAEREFLESRNVRAALGYCRQCARCVAGCPAGVQVPTLMRAHLYAVCYGNGDALQAALAELPPGAGLEACRDCRTCRVACVQGIPVAERLAELQRIVRV